MNILNISLVKKSLFIGGFILVVLMVLSIYHYRFVFKKSCNLSYSYNINEVDRIDIQFVRDGKLTGTGIATITDRDNINEIFDYISQVELIEVDRDFNRDSSLQEFVYLDVRSNKNKQLDIIVIGKKTINTNNVIGYDSIKKCYIIKEKYYEKNPQNDIFNLISQLCR